MKRGLVLNSYSRATVNMRVLTSINVAKFKEARLVWVLGLPKIRGVVWGRTLKASLNRVGRHIGH